MKKLLLYILSICTIIFVISCDNKEEFIEDNNENIDSQSGFVSITEGLNGYDELLVNESTIIGYKQQENGLPSSLILLVKDEEIEDYYNYVIFDKNGIPSYMNINNQSVYIGNVRGNKYDLLIINPDQTFFQIKDAEAQIDLENYWDDISSASRSAFGQSNTQNAVCLLNHLIGGVTMIEGGVDMLIGCAMLAPGANIAVGATIAIIGAAKFISGALLTTRATDLLVSDGSHTEGFDAASGLLGFAATAAGQGTITEKVVDILLNTGYDGLQKILDNTTDEEEIRAKADSIIQRRLNTGDVEKIDYVNNTVTLSGSITNKINKNDKVGIYISTIPDATFVENCGYSETNNSGVFTTSFEDLKEETVYYYRSYYYSSELNEYFVSKVKSFAMPGIYTGDYTSIDNDYFKISFSPIISKGMSVEAGVCYSATETEPTIDNDHSSIMVSEAKEYTINLKLTELHYYYRAYLIIDGNVIYGETRDLSTNENELLINFYNETNGDKWFNNTNWCSSKSESEWFGVHCWNVDDNYVRVNEIRLPQNNLSGTPIVFGFNDLYILDIRNNNITELTVKDCNIDSLNLEGCEKLIKLDIQRSTLETLITKDTKIKNINIYNTDFYSLYFGSLESLENIEVSNSNFQFNNIVLNNNVNLNSATFDNCIMGDAIFDGSNVKNVIIKNCKSFDPGYSFNGFSGGNFDYILIENSMEGNGQSFFSAVDKKTIIVNKMEFRNIDNLGRIFFERVIANEIYFYDCHFEHQGIGIEDYSKVDRLYIENCTIPGGRIGGVGTTTYLTNSIIGDWWAAEGYFVITNCTLEGIRLSISGTGAQIYEYLRDIKGY